jgi:DNA-binding winged helix-turn-helix (wHTH) protein
MNAEFASPESSKDKDTELLNNGRARYARFGAFCVDLRTRELSKDGAQIKLHHKVSEALVILLERPGEVVTRETFRARMWPSKSRLNYDANVNTTLSKLRLVLGDSFIETAPRKGYCFVAPVEYSDQTPTRNESGNGVPRVVFDTNHTNRHGDVFRQPASSVIWFRAGVVALVAAAMLFGAAVMLYTRH